MTTVLVPYEAHPHPIKPGVTQWYPKYLRGSEHLRFSTDGKLRGKFCVARIVIETPSAKADAALAELLAQPDVIVLDGDMDATKVSRIRAMVEPEGVVLETTDKASLGDAMSKRQEESDRVLREAASGRN